MDYVNVCVKEKGSSMSRVKGNDGFTMVEMIICIGIAAILLTMVAIAINAAIKSSRNAKNNTILQNEAQVALNQLAQVLMEAESVEAGTITAPDKKYLVRTYEDNAYYIIYLNANEGCLYMAFAEDITKADSIDLENKNARYQYLLAEYVDDLSIDISSNLVNIIIRLVLGDVSFTGQKTISMRNK